MVSVRFLAETFVLFLQLQYSSAQVFDPSSWLCSGLQSACAQVNGIIDGTRCYFVGNVGTNRTDWNNAWAVCRSYGAVLAKGLTRVELDNMWSVGQAYTMPFQGSLPRSFIYHMLFSLHDNTWSFPNTAVTTNTTFWFDSETQPNLNLPASQTYARYSTSPFTSGDVGTAAVPRCISLVFTDDPCDTTFGWFPLCQASTFNDKYMRTNVCLLENPIQTTTTGVIGPQDCADACAKLDWCRSFNFLEDTVGCISHSCQFFTWSINDPFKIVQQQQQLITPVCITIIYHDF